MLQDTPYHYCMALERAMCELFGGKSRWYNSAGSYQEPKHVREALLAATTHIRKRLEDIITIDARLEASVAATLDGLEAEIRKIGKQQNQIEITAHLLRLVAYLIGYGRLAGKPIRQVVFFQTADQARYEDQLMRKENPLEAHAFEVAKRREVVRLLHGQGLRVTQIARVMKIAEHLVKDYLQDVQ